MSLPDAVASLPDAVATAASVRARESSPAEVVAGALGRIEGLDPMLNAIVHRRDDRALDEAEAVGRDRPFAGVPIVVKDSGLSMAGEPATLGMELLRAADFRSPVDSALVLRLRAAGFIIVGRSNVPELCTAGTTEPLAFGPTRNPWDTSRSPGGSSGGSAAAVAAGMVAVAHGSDGGGSVRMPAACCGIVGLKPSRGRVSAAPSGAPWSGLSTDGVLARTVRDAAAVLDVMAGPEPGDPFVAPALPGPLAAEVGLDPEPVRVGLRLHGAGDADPTHPEVAAAIRRLAGLLERLGHVVDEAWPVALDDLDAPGIQAKLVAADVTAEIGAIGAAIGRPITGADLEGWNSRLLDAGLALGASELVQAREWLIDWARRLGSWWRPFGAYDFLLTPVITQPVFELGWMSPERSPEETAGIRRHLGWLLGAWNVTGQPAISLPAGFAAGLPVGAQLVAAPGREDLLVRVAAQIEAAAPWSTLPSRSPAGGGRIGS